MATTTLSLAGPVASLRHELLTPINHLLGYSEMLLEDGEMEPGEALGGPLREIRESTRGIHAIIDRILPPGTVSVDYELLTQLRNWLREPITKLLEQVQNATTAGASLGADGPMRDVETIREAALRLHALASDGMAAVESPPVPAHPAAGAAHAATQVSRRGASGKLLIVDDDPSNRDLLARKLQHQGYQTAAAENGHRALEMLACEPFDLVLLDYMMPEMDGAETLAALKSDSQLRHVPVIMISAVGDLDHVVRCIELGAEDYLPKPFEPVLLEARLGACLEKKRLRDAEKRKNQDLEAALSEVNRQKQIADSLLRNILPDSIADELMSAGQVEPRYFEDVTIAFTDFVSFTLSTEKLAAEDLVTGLHQYFTAFDRITQHYGLEKLKTIGDSYMFAGGLPVRSPSHPVDVVMACFEILHAVEEIGSRQEAPPWQIRIGVHTGPVIAGVVGIRKFAFDIWGETVNFSSRMESAGEPGQINVSERTLSRIKDFFECQYRGKVLTKEKREVDMYFVKGIQKALLEGAGNGLLSRFARRYRIYFQKEPRAFPQVLLGEGR